MRPMLATPADLPTGGGWAFEVKWDGVRAIIEMLGGHARLYSRRDNDRTGTYPELTALAGIPTASSTARSSPCATVCPRSRRFRSG